MPLEYGAGYHWSNVLEKGKKDLEVLALRNTSTTTPDKVVRSVGRTGIVGGKYRKNNKNSSV